MNISQWKIGDRTFFSLEVDDRLLLITTHEYLAGINPWISSRCGQTLYNKLWTMDKADNWITELINAIPLNRVVKACFADNKKQKIIVCLPWAGCRCPLNKKKMIDLFVCLLTVWGVTILCNMYLKIISAAAQCSISKVHRITSNPCHLFPPPLELRHQASAIVTTWHITPFRTGAINQSTLSKSSIR